MTKIKVTSDIKLEDGKINIRYDLIDAIRKVRNSENVSFDIYPVLGVKDSKILLDNEPWLVELHAIEDDIDGEKQASLSIGEEYIADVEAKDEVIHSILVDATKP